MSLVLSALLLNAAVATLLALLVWTAGSIPAVRRRPGLRHGLWFIVLLKLVTPPLWELSILPAWMLPTGASETAVIMEGLRPEGDGIEQRQSQGHAGATEKQTAGRM